MSNKFNPHHQQHLHLHLHKFPTTTFSELSSVFLIFAEEQSNKMHFQTVSVITSLLVASAAALPPAGPPAGHSGPPSGPPKHLPPCKPGHYWPDPFDCHSFFECAAGGHPVRKTCGPGAAYCWEVGVCVPEGDSKCSLPEGFQAHEFPGAKGHGPPSHGPPGKGPQAHGPPGKGPQAHGPPAAEKPKGHGPK